MNKTVRVSLCEFSSPFALKEDNWLTLTQFLSFFHLYFTFSILNHFISFFRIFYCSAADNVVKWFMSFFEEK